MTTAQVASEIGLHPKTVARFARENLIPGTFVGGPHGWVFDLQAVRQSLILKRGNKAARAQVRKQVLSCEK